MSRHKSGPLVPGYAPVGKMAPTTQTTYHTFEEMAHVEPRSHQ